ncbi:MAG: hypothetical protein GC168_02785 [Candidatus Hydrogenedens sp.]|nr:hypothetical protein [Candidatus Hydrogenedens sp.]
MLLHELRRPWALAAIAAAALVCALLLFDRWRTQPWQWPGNPEGIPSGLSGYMAKHHLDVDYWTYPQMSSASTLAQVLSAETRMELPPTTFVTAQESGLTLPLPRSAIDAMRELHDRNRESLAMAYKTAALITFDETPVRTMLRREFSMSERRYSSRNLQEVLQYEIMLCATEHDFAGAIRALETFYKLAESDAPYPAIPDQWNRVYTLIKAHNSVALLCNLMPLSRGQWDEVMALSRKPGRLLLDDIRDAMEYTAMQELAKPSGFRHTGISNIRPVNDDFWYPQFPYFTSEIFDSAVYAITGRERMDQTAAARFAIENSRHFGPFDTLAYDRDSHRSVYQYAIALNDITQAASGLERNAGACVLYPALIQAAAAISCFRDQFGRFPDTLDEIPADCLRSLQDGPEAIGVLFNDRYVNRTFQYRRTSRGVVVYSVGFNRRDDTLDDDLRWQNIVENKPGLARTMPRNENYGDDIRFEILARSTDESDGSA